MAPVYKLSYFQFAGLAEPIRLLFHYGGIEFEDYRFDREQWPQIKPTTPFGQAPILEHNGKVVNQHTAIARYVAKQVQLIGKDDWENLEIDAIVDTIGDLLSKMRLYMQETDEKAKELKKQELYKETVPFFFERLEALTKKNNGYLAIDRLSWADIYFVGLLYCMNGITGTDLVENYPNLKTLVKKVEEIPRIKAWIEKRPKTER